MTSISSSLRAGASTTSTVQTAGRFPVAGASCPDRFQTSAKVTRWPLGLIAYHQDSESPAPDSGTCRKDRLHEADAQGSQDGLAVAARRGAAPMRIGNASCAATHRRPRLSAMAGEMLSRVLGQMACRYGVNPVGPVVGTLIACALQRSHQCLSCVVQPVRWQCAGRARQLGDGESVTRIEGGECQQRCVLPIVLAQCRIVARGVEEGWLEHFHKGAVQAGRPQEAFPSRTRFRFGTMPVEELATGVASSIPGPRGTTR
jgi:hypothetical protein